MFYIHPWEIDPEQPRLNVGSRLSRWRHYLNLNATESKLERLLEHFRFGTLSEVVAWVERQQTLRALRSTSVPVVTERGV